MPGSRLLPFLIVVWFIAVIFGYHFGAEGFPALPLLSLLVDVVLLLLVAASAWGLGRAALAPFGLSRRDPGQTAVFEIGAGLGALALIIFAVSAAGILYRVVVVVVLAAGVVLLAAMARRGDAGAPRVAWSWPQLSMLGVLLAAGVATLAAALAPPQFYDALIYHLAVPQAYIRHHGMVAIAGNYYSHFPANLGMLYTVGLLLRGGELAQSLHWLCGALTVAALFAMVRTHLGRSPALVACLLLALTPGVLLSSTYAIADLGVALFGTLCFAAVLNLWRDSDPRWAVLAGIFAGLALGTKYTAALVVCLPAAAAILLRSRAGRRRWLDTLVFGAVALLAVSPWLGRNLVLTGNPVAPYFSAQEAGSPSIGEEIQRRLPDEPGVAGLAAHYLLAPWNVSMKRLGAAGYLGPVFLLLVPPLLFMRRLPPVVLPAALMAATGFAAWALTTQVTRYLFPVVPLLALLAAVSAGRLPRRWVLPAAGWCLAYGAFLYFFLVGVIGSYGVVSGAESRDDFLSRWVTYYPAMEYLESTPPDARVLFVGEGRTFYCPRQVEASTPFDAPVLEKYAASARPGPRGLAGVLRSAGFSHVLVSDPELRRTRNITADDLVRRFFADSPPRLVFERNGVRVYSLEG